MNKKAQYFNLALVLLTLAVLITALVAIKDKIGLSDDLGKSQTALISKYIQGEKLLLFIDLAAKDAAYKSVYDLGQNGGFAFGDEISASECESFNNFNLWNNENKECYPSDLELFNDLSILMEKYNLDYLLSTCIYYLPTNNYNINIKTNSEKIQFIGNSKNKIGLDVKKVPVSGDFGGLCNEKTILCKTGQCVIEVADYYYSVYGPNGFGLPYVWGGETPYSYQNIKSCNDPFFDYSQITKLQPQPKESLLTIAGFDCSGFVWWIMKHAGIQDFNNRKTSTDYRNDARTKAINVCGDKEFKQTNSDCTSDYIKQNAQPGDIIFIQPKGDILGHIALYYGNNILIESVGGKGLMKREIPFYYLDQSSKNRIQSIYRFNYNSQGQESFKSSQNLEIIETSDYYLDLSFNIEIPYNINKYNEIKGNLFIINIKCAGNKNIKECLTKELPKNWIIKYNGDIIGSESDWNKYCKTEGNEKNIKIIQICIIDNSIKYPYTNPVTSKKEIMPVVIKFAYYMKESEAPLPIEYIEAADKRKAEGSIVLKWNASKSADVVKYNIYYVEGIYNFNELGYNLDAIKQLTTEKGGIINIDSKNTNDLFKDLNLSQKVDCVFNENKCTFEYMDKGKKSPLQDNALYNLTDKKQYVFSVSNLKDDADYTFLVTAVDADGNEIKMPSLFKLNENVVVAQSVDDLEPGIIEISEIKSELGNLILKWNKAEFNIDGSRIRDTEIIYYYIYNTTDIMTLPFVTNYQLVNGPTISTELKIFAPSIKLGFAVITWDKSTEPQPYPYFDYLKWKASE
jgi:cell wall-associated NlpC family hydrolase